MKPDPAYTDAQLAELLTKKDPAAFIFLYEKYAGALYGLISQVLTDKDSINQVFVEVFASIIGSIDQHDPAKSRLFTWMMQMARQIAITKLKAIPPRTYSGSAGNEPERKPVAGMMLDLHQDEQRVISLAYLKGYSVEEVAGELGMTADSVRAKMNKALLALNSQAKK